MHCFNHPDREAVGTCKACCKGLCHDCLTDLGHGIACKGAHEERVQDISNLITQNTRVYSAARKNIYLAPTFFSFMGFLFAVTGLRSSRGPTTFMIVMGFLLVLFGVAMYAANRRALGKIPPKD